MQEHADSEYTASRTGHDGCSSNFSRRINSQRISIIGGVQRLLGETSMFQDLSGRLDARHAQSKTWVEAGAEGALAIACADLIGIVHNCSIVAIVRFCQY